MKFETASSLNTLGRRLKIEPHARTSFGLTSRGVEIRDLDAGKCFTFRGGSLEPVVESFPVPSEVKAVVKLSDAELSLRWSVRQELDSDERDTIASEIAHRRITHGIKI